MSRDRKSFSGRRDNREESRGSQNRNKFEKRDRPSAPKKFYKKPDEQEDKAKSFILKRKLDKISKQVEKDTIRLNKYIANSGICSRREADELITQGLVEVNGKVVTEMGYQVQKTDRVVFDGQSITPEKPVYVLLNKPKGYISTTKDEKARKTVMDLVANASPYRLFPVGRLDRQTTGLILLTNDGHLTKKLTHPSFGVKKIYHVTFKKMGYEVEALDRVIFAGLTKKNIKRGHWRILTEMEVNNLKML